MSHFLNPKEVIKDLSLKDDMIVADFGCGSGGWTIPLAEQLSEGVVYGIDILNEPLSALRSKMQTKNIANIKTVEEDVERGLSMADGKVDMVLMSNFLFQIENRKKAFEEAKRVLSRDGKLLVVGWKPEADLGPENKFPPAKVKSLAEDYNFELIEEFQAGLYHYGFSFKKL